MELLARPLLMARRARALVPALYSVARFPLVSEPRRHRLPGRLIVSVTSYPPRYPTLAYTLRSLLDQHVKADRTILWVTASDYELLPRAVFGMRRFGLEIETCPEQRSFKKILPALERAPESFIVTADDDTYYDSRWLEALTDQFDTSRPAVLCRRAHLARREHDGTFAPYSSWPRDLLMEGDSAPRSDVFPTGSGGVLYYPGALPPRTLDYAVASKLCPSADDIWLYWMGRTSGTLYRQVGGPFDQLNWPYTHRVGLYTGNNEGGGNDAAFRAMQAHFGSIESDSRKGHQ